MLLKWHLWRLTSQDWAVRVRSAEKLGRSGSPAAVEPLVVVALLDPVKQVREAAATALDAVRRPEAIQMLVITAVKANLEWQMMDLVFSAAAFAIHKIHAPEGINAVVSAIISKDSSVRSNAEAIWKKLIEMDVNWVVCCARPLQREIVQLLSTETDLDVCEALIGFLGKLHDPNLRPVFEILSGDSRETVRAAAIEAMGPILQPGDIPKIVPFLSDPSESVRKVAALLPLLRSPSALDALTAQLECETVEAVRRVFVEAIGGINTLQAERVLAKELTRFGSPGTLALNALLARGWKPSSASEKAWTIVQEGRLDLLDDTVALGAAAVEPLLAVVRSDNPSDMTSYQCGEFATRAACLLGKFGDRRALAEIEALHQRLSQKPEFEQLRKSLLEPMIALGGEEVVQRCIGGEAQLDDAVVRGLETFGKKAVPFLVKILAARNGSATAESLKRLGWKPKTKSEKACLLVAEGHYLQAAELGAVAAAPLVGAILRQEGQTNYVECEGKAGNMPMAWARADYKPADALLQVLSGSLKSIEPQTLQRIARIESFTVQFTAVGNCNYAEQMSTCIDFAQHRQLARQELIGRGIQA